MMHCSRGVLLKDSFALVPWAFFHKNTKKRGGCHLLRHPLGGDITHVERGECLRHALLDEVVRDAAGGVFVEDGVHQGDLGRAASCFGLGGAELPTGGGGSTTAARRPIT